MAHGAHGGEGGEAKKEGVDQGEPIGLLWLCLVFGVMCFSVFEVVSPFCFLVLFACQCSWTVSFSPFYTCMFWFEPELVVFPVRCSYVHVLLLAYSACCSPGLPSALSKLFRHCCVYLLCLLVVQGADPG